MGFLIQSCLGWLNLLQKYPICTMPQIMSEKLRKPLRSAKHWQKSITWERKLSCKFSQFHCYLSWTEGIFYGAEWQVLIWVKSSKKFQKLSLKKLNCKLSACYSPGAIYRACFESYPCEQWKRVRCRLEDCTDAQISFTYGAGVKFEQNFVKQGFLTILYTLFVFICIPAVIDFRELYKRCN